MPDQDPVLDHYESIRNYTSEVLAAMPEAGAGFRPAPGLRSFADLARHVISAERTLLQALREGVWVWDQGVTEEAWPTLASVRDLLDRTTGEGLALYRSEDPGRPLVASWGTFPLRHFLFEWLVHEAHHRGQMVTYLRLSGVRPPEYH
jgi:uncharacterized damage-inducible protein DinB